MSTNTKKPAQHRDIIDKEHAMDRDLKLEDGELEEGLGDANSVQQEFPERPIEVRRFSSTRMRLTLTCIVSNRYGCPYE